MILPSLPTADSQPACHSSALRRLPFDSDFSKTIRQTTSSISEGLKRQHTSDIVENLAILGRSEHRMPTVLTYLLSILYFTKIPSSLPSRRLMVQVPSPKVWTGPFEAIYIVQVRPKLWTGPIQVGPSVLMVQIVQISKGISG